MGIRTILVDDEALARERLQGLLDDHTEIEVVGEASDGIEAVEKINVLRPDLVFLDIEMSGFNGFKVVQSLDHQRLPKIIFVTAYNQYAIDAFEVGAIDYLLKPVKKSRLLEAIERAKTGLRKERHDLATAQEVQKRMLPDQDVYWENIEATGACLAVNEVGGDYYDFLKLSPNRFGLCIADISGKGFAAALMMANLQASLRILANEISEPAALMTQINKSFYENSVPEMYATLFYGVYDRPSRHFTFCNAGHNPPLHFRGERVKKLAEGGTVVGMFATANYEQASIRLAPGDVVVAYSDGLVELTDEAGQEFGEKSLASAVQPHLNLSALELKTLLLGTVESLSRNEKRQDDLTIAILKVAE
jgi:serine phosphatase RsbU (regulator of sigma subunit)